MPRFHGRHIRHGRRTALTVLPAAVALIGAALLAGCATPSAPVRPVTHDLGPGLLATPPSNRMAPLLAMALAEVEAAAALDSTALTYRLLYADAQQPRPYALARWSAPPAQLLQQRLRETLGQRRAVLQPGDPGAVLLLRVELDEFSQVFEAPERSAGLVKLRATVLALGSGSAPRLLAQRAFIVQRPAPSPDAAGGARALAAASDVALDELSQWLAQAGR